MIKEIQGLRSISVFLILFYHLNISYFKLGYLAVDIFFVISGIIFSKIIFNDLNNKKFSILNYSKKRIKKLFPGLIILIFLVTIISWLLLPPSELNYYGQSLFSVSLFISNIYYYIVNNDYFSPKSYSLLHLWSLSLELQFYVLYPILILSVNRLSLLKKNFHLIFFLLTVSSFNFNIFYSYDEKFIFYLLPARLWEFLIGYFIFFSINKKSKKNFFKENFYLILIFLLFFSYLLFGKIEFIKNQIYIISLTTIIFFISYNKKNIFNTFLINPFNQYIAKYSYNIFLVHFPVIYIFKYLGYYEKNFESISIIILTISILTILILYLENLFFKIKKNNFNTLKIKYLISILIIHSFIGYFFYQSNGVKLRYSLNQNLNSEYFSSSIYKQTSKKINDESCFILCRKLEGNEKTILLFGDSHAGDFEIQLTKILNKKNNLYLSYLNFTKTKIDDFDQINLVLKKEKIDFVFFIHHKREDNNSYLAKLENLLNTYKDVKFYYFFPRIEFFESPIKYKMLNRPINKIKKNDWDNHPDWKGTSKLLNSLNFLNLKLIDQNKILLEIDESNCLNIDCFDAHDKKNLPIYRDRHHFTNYGSGLFLKKLLKELSFD